MPNQATAKLIEQRGLQAVGLPREFRFPGTVVKLSKTERGVLLEPMDADFEAKKQAFARLAGSCPDLEDVPAHISPDLRSGCSSSGNSLH